MLETNQVRIRKHQNKFATFLQQHYVKKGQTQEQITNTRIGDKSLSISGGSYAISDEEYPTFLKLYFQEIVETSGKEYLTEKQLENQGPILVDIDFRYLYTVTNRQHTKEHIDDLICLYLDELKAMYQFDEEQHVPIFVFEKDQVNRLENKQVTKDGIHLIIGLQTDRNVQIRLRERVLAKITDIWKDLPIQNSWPEVFDEGIAKGHTGWQLYGSRKPNHEPYKLKYVYDVHMDPADGELMFPMVDPKMYETEERFPMLSVRYTKHTSLFFTSPFMEEQRGHRSTHSPSHLLSGGECTSNVSSLPLSTDIFNVQSKSDLEAVVQRFLDELQPMDYELREAYEYTMILPKTYYEPGSFTKWIRVGWALKNISNQLFVVWIAFSAQDTGFDYHGIRDLWDKWAVFGGEQAKALTKRSIMYWVRQENIELYKKVQTASIDYYVDMTLERINISNADKGCRGSGDFDIATVLYHLFKDEYVCVSIKANVWYRFKNHKWSEIDSGTSLRRSISEELRDIYTRKVSKIHRQIASMDPEDDRTKFLKKKSEIITMICDRLSRTNDKKNIMTEAKELFYDTNFLDKLDTNPYVICFTNGVIDFKEKIFRKGVPEDYLSKCTNIAYMPLEKHSQMLVTEINAFLHQLFPEPSLYSYMWDHLASCMLGTCDAQTVNMYTGTGRNGKSKLIDLMGEVLGEYKADVSPALITQQRGKIGGCSPELVQLKSIRLAVIVEPSKSEKINEGVLKSLVGGYMIQGRGLYSPQVISFKPQFKLVVCSNVLLPISSTDFGTWRRIRVVDFESLFTENPTEDDPEKPYQFKLDATISERYPVWREVFAAMLVNHAFQTAGVVVDCDKVMASSNRYREKQDVVSEFIADRICKCPHRCISKADLADNYKEWFASNYGGKCANVKEMNEVMEKQYGKARDGMYVGVRIKNRGQTFETSGEESISTTMDLEDGLSV